MNKRAIELKNHSIARNPGWLDTLNEAINTIAQRIKDSNHRDRKESEYNFFLISLETRRI